MNAVSPEEAPGSPHITQFGHEGPLFNLVASNWVYLLSDCPPDICDEMSRAQLSCKITDGVNI